MKIRMMSSFAGATVYHAGDEAEIPDAIAIRLIERGCAVPVREKAIETAVTIAPEKAVKRRGKRNVEPS
jgi:hypothetical protein